MKSYNFIDVISKKCNSIFDEIYTTYNFDNGDEFEIALCKLLRILLPTKYGIVRGFIIDKFGNKAGDDIIIYDQERFPTLRLLESENFFNKSEIPFEAVYAYIEAKHTLYIEEKGGQSLEKALSQIENIKNLKRDFVPLNKLNSRITIEGNAKSKNQFWPEISNPFYTAIISRNIKPKLNSSETDSKKLHNSFLIYGNNLINNSNCPDLLIAGSNFLGVPAMTTQIESPFYIRNLSHLALFQTQGASYGIGLSFMMYALDYILLGNLHWPTILANGLNLELNN
jgi:hypothetical protein